jgi:flagellin
MRIHGTDFSNSIAHSISTNERRTDRALKQLATGKRITSAGDDAAGLAISEQLDSYTKSFQSALVNAETSNSYFDIAEGALNEQSNILTRLRELSVQAASGQFSNRERDLIQLETKQLQQEFDRIAKSTRYGSQPILDGSRQNYEFQVGIDGSSNSRITIDAYPDTTASELDVDSLDVSTASDARDSLKTIDEASYQVMKARAQFGAYSSRMESARNHIENQIAGNSEGYSRITDARVDESVVQARRGQILAQYQLAALGVQADLEKSLLKLVV